MNSKGHLILSLIKSFLRCLGCILCLTLKEPLWISSAFLGAEVLGILEELVDHR